MYRTKGRKEKRPTFTFRTSRLILDKLFYISGHNGHYMNDEIEHLVKRHIRTFEEKHGEITYELIDDVKKRD